MSESPAKDEVAQVTEDVKKLDLNHPTPQKVKELEAKEKDSVYRSEKAPKELLDGIVNIGWATPTKIQADALPLILGNERADILAQAHHGSGKTGTFGLSVLSSIDLEKKYPQAIINVSVLMELGKFMKGLEIFEAVAGCKHGPTPAQILVGTPGGVFNKVRSHRGNKPDCDPRQIKIFVCDEADVLTKKGKSKKQSGLADRTIDIKDKLGKDVQTLLFSATWPKQVRKFAKALCRKGFHEITIKDEELTLEGVKQFAVYCRDQNSKYDRLKDIFGYITELGQTIIFVQRVDTGKELAQRLRKDGVNVALHHGKDMTQDQRKKIMKEFKDGKATILISTNVLSRGIDVVQVTLVINYDVPIDGEGNPDPETYLHRIGRSGRYGRKGVGITLVHNQRSEDNLDAIEKTYGKEIVKISGDKVALIDDAVKEQLKKNK